MKNRSRGIGQGTRPGIVEALGAVGELLAAEGEMVRIVVVGGTALILRGLVSRLTDHGHHRRRAFAGTRCPGPNGDSGSVTPTSSARRRTGSARLQLGGRLDELGGRCPVEDRAASGF